MRLRLPEERPTEPPTGYKIAHPVLSQDGTRAGFTGVSLGGALPYGVVADASCVYGLRHAAPHRRCDCGFHCVHDRSVAEGLLCTAEHRTAVLLKVLVLGRYIRFERGFRYARQRVRTATVGPCACGTTAAALADAGWGRPGWHALAPSCAGCLRGRTSVSLASFARLAGEGLRVVAGAGAGAAAGASGAPERSSTGPGEAGLPPASPPADLGVPELVAEAALLQARLDWFQAQLARLGRRGGGDVGHG
ncbi:hypothetical protein SSP24_19100 [Streptomyces spinoverrucosus]|uniref:Uncharacterized protein n=1 Tax=Streptomyces spinoverrucosus TaxID=284043 RepID=A0A4Y3VD84_9ACTN|nr:hypothetical protein [Streptomyces spinoverrucosus]GEC04255.1 hypothetical protein SSP24_19100 [Streptomyces spinoverrucosus]GHB47244.1 hypothetical protein GCM10010397_16560 [Streptomyces spinoverrucosus]